MEEKRRGFSLFELLIVLLILGTLLALIIPNVVGMVQRSKVSSAKAQIASIGNKIDNFLMDNLRLPESLLELEGIHINDPWGNSYQYLPILGKDKNEVSGKWRKDRFLVPLNSDFDLYSMGKDGRSVAPITAKDSYDDIIRANNGNYIGLAHKY